MDFEIKAHVSNVARVSYATSLMRESVLISTTEHLLAALYSCGIDNVYVEIDALELPILDGSAKPFIEMLASAGTRKLRRQRRYIRILKPLEFSDGDRRIGIYPAKDFRIHCFVDYDHPAAGPQEVEMAVDRETFSRELAPARTFTFVKELTALQKMGLIRGGSLANAIVMDDTSILNGPLRFPDEFGRHKALDLIGDLALVGTPFAGADRGAQSRARASHATRHTPSCGSFGMDRNHTYGRCGRTPIASSCVLSGSSFLASLLLLRRNEHRINACFDCQSLPGKRQ